MRGGEDDKFWQLLQVELDDLNVFRTIEDAIGVVFLDPQSDSAKSKAKNQGNRHHHHDQHDQGDDEAAGIVFGSWFGRLIQRYLRVVIDGSQQGLGFVRRNIAIHNRHKGRTPLEIKRTTGKGSGLYGFHALRSNLRGGIADERQLRVADGGAIFGEHYLRSFIIEIDQGRGK